jgi:hypothetical protein
VAKNKTKKKYKINNKIEVIWKIFNFTLLI